MGTKITPKSTKNNGRWPTGIWLKHMSIISATSKGEIKEQKYCYLSLYYCITLYKL